MAGRLSFMLVAGEASGDAHAAALVRALRSCAPDISFEFYGSTGAQMRAAGVETVVRADKLAILGLLEIGRALPKFWRAFRTLRRAAIERRPDAVIFVDWPDFNLKLARSLHGKGLRTIYYISPQLWAWRAHRLHSIRRDVDLMLCILPFEPEWYGARGYKQAQFTGHPLVGEVRASYGREEFCARLGLDAARPIVALLPGSRHKELERILPPMLDAASVLARSRPETQFVIALAPARAQAEAERIINDKRNSGAHTLPPVLRIVHNETREALAAADAAAVASGTATLEAAILETPLVIVYKESFINWHTLGRLISAEHYGLVNLIAGERLSTELMQKDLTGERLALELSALLDKERNQTVRKELRRIVRLLGAGGASVRAADVILRAVGEKIEEEDRPPRRPDARTA